ACRPPSRCRAHGWTCPGRRTAGSPCAGTPPRRAGEGREVPAIRCGVYRSLQVPWTAERREPGGTTPPTVGLWGPAGIDASVAGKRSIPAGGRWTTDLTAVPHLAGTRLLPRTRVVAVNPVNAVRFS